MRRGITYSRSLTTLRYNSQKVMYFAKISIILSNFVNAY